MSAISVVLATGHSGPPGALDALRACAAHVDLSCVRVSPQDGRAPAEQEWEVPCASISVPPGTLVPAQWGAGAVATSAPVVAFTTTDMIVDPSWAGTLLRAVQEGAAGAAGEIRVATHAGINVRAVYLMRYSAYAPPITPGPVRDIPADNAAYARTVLNLVPDLAGGFWEAELHRRLPPEAGPLMLVAGAGATLVSAPSPTAFVRQRYRHGVRFGAFRVSAGGEAALAILLRAPLVPAVLLARIGRRCLARPGLRRTYVACFPLLLVFAVAWALGEAMGALRPGRREERDRA